MASNILIKCLYNVGRIAYAGCLLNVVTNYIAEPTLCFGQSMQPTINSTSKNDVVLTEHISTCFKRLKRNDIVIVRSPREPNTAICKRITGMEDDVIHTDIVSLDDADEQKIMRVSLIEHAKQLPTCKIINPENRPKLPSLQVPKGHVWLSGDNVDNSVDSRTYGPVPYGLILGRVCYRLYPFSQFGPIE